MLYFRHIYGGRFYWANADGTEDEQLGYGGYEVRKFGENVVRWRAVDPDNYIIGYYTTRTQAFDACEAHAAAEAENETNWRD